MANRAVVPKPFKHVDLRGADLRGVYIGAAGRAAMVAEARVRRFPQSAITPVTVWCGHGYVFLYGTRGRPGTHNTVTVASGDPTGPGVEVELSGGSSTYRRITPTDDLATVLDAVSADYPPTSRMGLFVQALTEGIRAWITTGAAKASRFGFLDVNALQEATIAPLRPLLDLPPDPDSVAELNAANLLVCEPAHRSVPADTAAVAVGLLTLVTELTEARYAARRTIAIRHLDETLAAAYGGQLWRVAQPELNEFVTGRELDMEIDAERAKRLREREERWRREMQARRAATAG